MLGRKAVRAEYPPDRIGGSVDAASRNAVERRQPGGGVMLGDAGTSRHGPALCIYLKPIISADVAVGKAICWPWVPDRRATLSPVIPGARSANPESISR